MFRSIIKDKKGTIIVEYALLVALIAVGCVVAVGTLGANVLGLFTLDGLLGHF